MSEWAGRAFGLIALSQSSRGATAPIARRILVQQPSASVVVLDDTTFDAATFADDPPELARLRDAVCFVGDLRTAFVFVRGRHYPAGQHARLYQWLSCYQRMRAMRLPLGACDYCVAGTRLPCSLLGAFCGHELAAQPDPAQFLRVTAARLGFDSCPRYALNR